MFFTNYRSLYNKQFERAEKLEQRVKELNECIDNHNKSVTAAAREDVATSTFTINWALMNVFSIERLMEDQYRAKTVIGYYIQEPVISEFGTSMKNVVHEWTLRCSHEEHQRLVAEFRDYLNTTKGKK